MLVLALVIPPLLAGCSNNQEIPDPKNGAPVYADPSLNAEHDASTDAGEGGSGALDSTNSATDEDYPGLSITSGTMVGFRLSDIHLAYQGSSLPEGITKGKVFDTLELRENADSNGKLRGGYEYYLVEYTITNESNDSGVFYLNNSCLIVLANDGELLDMSAETIYPNGRNIPTDYSKEICREELGKGQTATYSVMFVMNSQSTAQGSLCFVADTSMGMTIDSTVLPFDYVRIA
jgi:hypothetical protein